MARFFIHSVPIRVLKEHTCAACAATFSYVMVRRVRATSIWSADHAAELAENKAEPTAANESDPHPCPTCGLYQPDMIAKPREKFYRLAILLSLAAMAYVLAERFSHRMSIESAGHTMATLSLLLAVSAAAIEYWLGPSNRDLQKNLRVAASQIAARQLRSSAPGTAQPEWRSPKSAYRLALSLLIAAAVIALAPQLTRVIMGWPLNPRVYPQVIGPGDRVRMETGQTFASINGDWWAKTSVTLLPHGSSKTIKVDGYDVGGGDSWGRVIYFRFTQREHIDRPWAEFSIPDYDGLANTTVKADVLVHVERPQLVGFNRFQNAKVDISQQINLSLASRGAGDLYVKLSRVSTILASALLLFTGFLLKRSANLLAATANSSRVLPVPTARAPGTPARQPHPTAPIGASACPSKPSNPYRGQAQITPAGANWAITRHRSPHLTIFKIEQPLAERKRQIAILHRDRGTLQKRLNAVDTQITVIGGNGETLEAAVEALLCTAGTAPA